MDTGKLVISLDFELHWGVVDKMDLTEKKEYFDNTRKSIPLILALFEKYEIHATWATVGFLFAKNKSQLLDYIPKVRPTYSNSNLNYYKLIDEKIIGDNELEDPYHFAYSLIKLIVSKPNQELASHTFSHYYCNESGQTCEQFENDLIAAQDISLKNFNIKLKSLVLPRNQFNFDYMDVAFKNGINTVRSNPDVWFWNKKSKLSPLFRALDTLIPISSSLSYKNPIYYKKELLLLPSSRFYRAFSKSERSIHFLKNNRIINEMNHAAKNQKIYHLWWHPHNFGQDLTDNIYYLEEVLKHYKKLEHKFGFSSSTMDEMWGV